MEIRTGLYVARSYGRQHTARHVAFGMVNLARQESTFVISNLILKGILHLRVILRGEKLQQHVKDVELRAT